ncbi:hypothetical protein [Marinicellulosiphila megalodicopiae]|uniref:hypothetical protein n=1 Tax=Marinicellulosiphila megalodicopiae TaxID=2724896 RepID=UPI003BAF1B52
MLKSKLLKNVSALCVCATVLVGCNSTDDTNTATQVTFEPKFNSLISTNGFARAADISSLYSGSMEILDSDNNVVDVQNWSVYLESDDVTGQFTAVSNKSLSLTPGQYTFNLSLTKGEHVYFGSTMADIDDGNFDVVPMIIKPILGVSKVNAQVTERIAELKLNFPQAQLVQVGATHLNITVNDDMTTSLMLLDPVTGTSSSVSLWHVVETGEQNIKLELLRNGQVIAHSITEQETQSIYYGKNINMDLIPLYGEVAFSVSEHAADAVFDFTVPSEVMAEAGGAHNLDVRFQVTGQFNQTDQLLSTLTEDANGNGIISVTLADFQYDTMDVVLTFIDNMQDEIIGNCVAENVVLNQNVTALNCDITLRRRGAISGSLLANYAINTFDYDGNIVENASIFVDGELVGITGNHQSLSAGYLNTLIASGEHTIEAQSVGLQAQQVINVTPLSVNNIDIMMQSIINSNIPVVVHIDKTQAPTPPAGMKVTCMMSADSLASSSTCPVIQYNDIEYWAFSYTDNRSSIGLVGYDAGMVVSQQELSGVRYVWDITVNENNETVSIFGQSTGQATIDWAELVDSTPVNNIPVVVHIDKTQAPTPPAGMKVTCMMSADSLASSSTCPVIQYNDVEYWAFSYTDNRSSIGLVGYAEGMVVSQQELSGVRYVWDITVNENNETVSIFGQSTGQATIDWTELVDSTAVNNIPVVVHIDKTQSPTPPAGMKVTCMMSADSLASSSTCPVIQYNDIEYWAFSYTDNRSSIGLVGYDAGMVVSQQELSGVRYVWDITVNESNETVSIFGQSTGQATIDWAALVDSTPVNNIPVVVHIDKTQAPTPPAGMKVTCMMNADSLASSSTCPVIQYNDIEYWAFSYTDNRSSIGLVGYAAGMVVSQQELSGVRYVWDITVNENNETVSIFGQSTGVATVSWLNLD